MTWFLPQDGEIPDLVPQGPDRPLSPFSETLGAAFRQFNIDHNTWARRSGAQWDAEAVALGEAMPRLGEQVVLDSLKRSGMVPDTLEALPIDALRYNPKAKEEIFRLAREAQTAEPQKWNGIDLTPERIERDTNAPLQADYADAQDIIEMSPSPGVPVFLGGAAAGIADPRALPFLFAGGAAGGAILKVLAREAAINMAVEATTLPSQYEMAERLNIPDPDVRTQLLTAAVGGAIFGGMFEAGSRGITYFRNRAARRAIPGVSPVQAEMAVEAAENAIVAGRDPFADVQTVIDSFVTPQPAPREPLILTDRVPAPDSPLVPNQIEERRLPTLPGQKPEPIPNEDLIAGLEEALKVAKENDRRGAKPLMSYMRSTWKSAEPLQVHPEGRAAAELKARGITPKTAPGLFSKRGRKDFDNLPATEWADMFPGIMEATGTRYGDTYLDQEGFLSVLTRDLQGDATWLRMRKDVLDLEAQLAEAIDRPMTAAEDFTSGAKADGGFFVDLNAYQFDNLEWEADIARDFERYLSEKWEGTFFTPDEKAEMLDHLRSRGGDAEFLVERMAERELDETARPQEVYDNGIPFGDDAAPQEGAVGPGAGDSGRPEVGAMAGAEGTPGSGNAEGPLQAVIPGTERTQTGVDQRQRAEIAARQQQSMIRRLDQSRVEDDAGGLFGGAQRDMFSEPAGNEDRAVQDQIAADVRDDIAKSGDVKLELETVDGAKLRSKQAVLDYIDEGDRVSARLDLCGKGPA